MDDHILDFISQFVTLTEEEADIITKQNSIKFYPKDTILLSEGELAKECFFILKGCVRSYYVLEGEEKTTEFYTENQGINPASYINKKPSEYYLACLEDCVIAIADEEQNRLLLERVPKLESMVIQMSRMLMMEKQLTLDDFKNLSPEKRYLKLIESRPDLFQRAPLYQIASYLGITPVSLSRMRKRITVKPDN